ncbi:ABC transporter permease [Mesorhizobium hawassense]|uniref:ABC transporter permease n=2 Tax=Mesorhizobium hawassense TaxID=1209954 RepID=A0A330HQI4_9HYPH|nr:ABC transporter permease [Mesorhizobium hawassense]
MVELRQNFFGIWAAIKRNPSATAGIAVLLAWGIVAILAPVVAPYDPTAIDFLAAADPMPSSSHWLGTDSTGRDILSRIIWGARTTYTVVPLSVFAAFIVGIALGMPAGYFGGWIDTLVSRASDIMLSFPALILYIILITSFGPSLCNIVIAVTLAYAPGVSRLARAITLSLREQDYVAAAQVRGETSLYIMAVEILPNARGPLTVDLCLRAGYTVILTGTLGFLGLGLPPPTADWGGMVVENGHLLSIYWHMTVFPCLAISSVVISCNLVADSLRGGRTR